MRKSVSKKTIKSISDEIADISVSSEAIEVHLPVLIELLRGIDQLRALPIKEAEPATIFTPIEDKI